MVYVECPPPPVHGSSNEQAAGTRWRRRSL